MKSETEKDREELLLVQESMQSCLRDVQYLSENMRTFAGSRAADSLLITIDDAVTTAEDQIQEALFDLGFSEPRKMPERTGEETVALMLKKLDEYEYTGAGPFNFAAPDYDLSRVRRFVQSFSKAGVRG